MSGPECVAWCLLPVLVAMLLAVGLVKLLAFL